MSKGLKLLADARDRLLAYGETGSLIGEINEYIAEKNGKAETKEGKPLDAPGDVTTFDAPADPDDTGLIGGRPDDRH